MAEFFPNGTTVELTTDYDVFPLGVFRKGLQGVVVGTYTSYSEEEDFVAVKLDEPFDSLDEWGNELHVRHPDMFLREVE